MGYVYVYRLMRWCHLQWYVYGIVGNVVSVVRCIWCGAVWYVVCVCGVCGVCGVRGLCMYSKTSLNRPTMGPSLSGSFREVVGLMSSNMGDRYTGVVDLWRWSVRAVLL